tara:strand:+ start:1371 stop:1646 length:276 start_codon:yes stop_codon:yes gene_type:complete
MKNKTKENKTMNDNNDEIILIAHLSKAFSVSMDTVINDWNDGNIFCFDWVGLIKWYQGFEDLLDGTIEEAIRFDIDKGIVVKIQNLYFMYA